MLNNFIKNSIEYVNKYFTYVSPISHSSQCSMTGVTKAVVCVILSMHIKEPLLEGVAHVEAAGFLSHYLNGRLP